MSRPEPEIGADHVAFGLNHNHELRPSNTVNLNKLQLHIVLEHGIHVEKSNTKFELAVAHLGYHARGAARRMVRLHESKKQ